MDAVRSVAEQRARARQIRARDPGKTLRDDLPRYWMGGDAYSTHLMNVLSLMFPPGERMFMDAVNHFRPALQDARLREQVAGFLAQEGRHGREHGAFNRWLSQFGIDADGLERSFSAHIARRRKKRTPLDDLAVTCALEHVTAVLAEGWLTREDLRTMASEPMQALWTWHALEELDHKSVALDVYRAVGGGELRRLRWALRIALTFMLGVSVLHVRFMLADGTLRDPQYIARRWWKYWGPGGYYRALLPAFLQYFRPYFHPWQRDHAELVAHYDALLGT